MHISFCRKRRVCDRFEVSSQILCVAIMHCQFGLGLLIVLVISLLT